MGKYIESKFVVLRVHQKSHINGYRDLVPCCPKRSRALLTIDEMRLSRLLTSNPSRIHSWRTASHE